MPHDHSHSGHEHHAGKPPRKWTKLHTIFVIAVGLMLVAMVIYVATMDEAVAPGIKPGAPVPAAP